MIEWVLDAIRKPPSWAGWIIVSAAAIAMWEFFRRWQRRKVSIRILPHYFRYHPPENDPNDSLVFLFGSEEPVSEEKALACHDTDALSIGITAKNNSHRPVTIKDCVVKLVGRRELYPLPICGAVLPITIEPGDHATLRFRRDHLLLFRGSMRCIGVRTKCGKTFHMPLRKILRVLRRLTV